MSTANSEIFKQNMFTEPAPTESNEAKFKRGTSPSQADTAKRGESPIQKNAVQQESQSQAETVQPEIRRTTRREKHPLNLETMNLIRKL